MIELSLNQAHILENILNDPTDSATLSCFEGLMGKAFADDTVTPTVGAVYLGEYLYIDGEPVTDFIREFAEYAKAHHATIVTVNSAIRAEIAALYCDKMTVKKRWQMDTVLETKDSHLFENINALGEEYELARFDENLYEQALQNNWSEYFVRNFKNYEDFEQNGLGYGVLFKGKLVCGTTSYSYYDKGYEVIIATHPDFRRRGLALACASAFILECLRLEKFPNWDCANEKSLALSTKLGYKLKREYEGIVLE